MFIKIMRMIWLNADNLQNKFNRIFIIKSNRQQPMNNTQQSENILTINLSQVLSKAQIILSVNSLSSFGQSLIQNYQYAQTSQEQAKIKIQILKKLKNLRLRAVNFQQNFMHKSFLQRHQSLSMIVALCNKIVDCEKAISFHQKQKQLVNKAKSQQQINFAIYSSKICGYIIRKIVQNLKQNFQFYLKTSQSLFKIMKFQKEIIKKRLQAVQKTYYYQLTNDQNNTQENKIDDKQISYKTQLQKYQTQFKIILNQNDAQNYVQKQLIKQQYKINNAYFQKILLNNQFEYQKYVLIDSLINKIQFKFDQIQQEVQDAYQNQRASIMNNAIKKIISLLLRDIYKELNNIKQIECLLQGNNKHYQLWIAYVNNLIQILLKYKLKQNIQCKNKLQLVFLPNEFNLLLKNKWEKLQTSNQQIKEIDGNKNIQQKINKIFRVLKSKHQQKLKQLQQQAVEYDY